MALLAGALIATILIGLGAVLFACTRKGRKVCHGDASRTEADAATTTGRSDLQGPHHLTRTSVPQKTASVATRAELEATSPEEFEAQLDADLQDVEDRINRRLDELDELVGEEEEDLGEMERYLDKSSRRDRRRNRRRPKNRRHDEPEDDDDAA